METVFMDKERSAAQRSLSIDWSLCVQRVAGNELLANDFLLHFVNELGVHKTDFLQQWADYDLQALERNAHKLHGAACFCGVPQLQKDVAFLERLAKNAESADVLHNAFLQLMNSIENVISDYTHHLKPTAGAS